MRPIASALALLLFLLSSAHTFAQENAPDRMLDTLYKSGKINTVIAVISVILLGLAAWMFNTDRRVRRLEEQLRK